MCQHNIVNAPVNTERIAQHCFRKNFKSLCTCFSFDISQVGLSLGILGLQSSQIHLQALWSELERLVHVVCDVVANKTKRLKT